MTHTTPIPTRRLSADGPEVSRIGLGLAALGRPGYLVIGHDEDLGDDKSVATMRSRAHDMLDLASDLGITYIDAARSYGRAEEFIASWPGAVHKVIGSKWGYTYTAGWQVDAEDHEIKDHSAATFLRQRAETDGLLGDRLDLYQVHSATLESGILDDDEVLDLLRAEPVLVGLSVSGPRQAQVIRKALAIPDTPFRCVQATWNLLEPSAGPALAQAHDAGWGVIIKEGVANGRLTERGDAAISGPTPTDQLAIAAALAQPFVDVVLSGASIAEHLVSNVRALDVDPSLIPDVPPEDPDAYWSHRSRLSWN